MRSFGIACLLAATALLASCGQGNKSGVTASEIDCATLTNAVEVNILDFAFDPQDAQVPDGGVVRWTNRGAVKHVVTSGRPDTRESGDLFDSGKLKVGESYCLQLTTAGGAEGGLATTLTYFDRKYPAQMHDATIMVGGTAMPGGSGAGGSGMGGTGLGGVPGRRR